MKHTITGLLAACAIALALIAPAAAADPEPDRGIRFNIWGGVAIPQNNDVDITADNADVNRLLGMTKLNTAAVKWDTGAIVGGDALWDRGNLSLGGRVFYGWNDATISEGFTLDLSKGEGRWPPVAGNAMAYAKLSALRVYGMVGYGWTPWKNTHIALNVAGGWVRTELSGIRGSISARQDFGEGESRSFSGSGSQSDSSADTAGVMIEPEIRHCPFMNGRLCGRLAVGWERIFAHTHKLDDGSARIGDLDNVTVTAGISFTL